MGISFLSRMNSFLIIERARTSAAPGGKIVYPAALRYSFALYSLYFALFQEWTVCIGPAGNHDYLSDV